MKFLVLLALVSLGQCAVLGSSKCTYGPSYWCSHVNHAKECGAMQHCIDRVWKQQLPQGMTGATEGCFDIIQSLDSVRRSGIAHNLIQKMAESCIKMPAEKQSVCKELMMNNENEVLVLLQSNLPSMRVAAALGLCGAFPDSVPHPQPHNDNKQDVQKTDDICTDCLNFFGDLQEIVNKSEERIAQNLKDKICVKLGYFENLCNQTVDTFTQFLLSFLAQQLNPPDLCYLFRFCNNGTEAEFVERLRSVAERKARFHSVECSVCENFAKDAQNALKNSAVQEKILSLLENDVCPLLGDLGTECKTYVSQYGYLVFQVLIAELDPANICQTLGLCNGSGVGAREEQQGLVTVGLGRGMTGVHLQAPPPHSQEQFSPQCMLCEFIMKKLEKEVLTNKTEEEIMKAMKDVCNLLPTQKRAECKSFVDQYGAEIFKLLQEMGPEAICTTLGLCPVPVDEGALKNGELCLVCEAVVTPIRDYLNNPDHQQTIDSALDKVCDLVPDSYRKMCTEMIAMYEPKLISLLNQYDDPLKVCTELRLCSSQESSDHSLTFLPMVEIQPALPAPCSKDPAVLCASLQAARRCNAVEYCVKNYLKLPGY